MTLSVLACVAEEANGPPVNAAHGVGVADSAGAGNVQEAWTAPDSADRLNSQLGFALP